VGMVWAQPSGPEIEYITATAKERASAEAETSLFMRFMLRHKPCRWHPIRLGHVLRWVRNRARLMHAMVYPAVYA
jgi:hypothetical protein